ncbi:MAG TPA: hypothetical protein VN258_06230 [Mobilitalea sp.]|nr:hypothetical protein [Mobilitalea sp.]
MKTNNISTALKIILLAVSAIVVCIAAFIGIKTTNEGKAMVNSGTTQVKAMTESYSNIDKASYDNQNIIGSALVDLIQTTIADKETLSIWVKTNSNATTGVYYNYTLTTAAGGNTIAVGSALTTITTDATSINYINPNAQFTGKVYKDVNKNIIAILFDQMD